MRLLQMPKSLKALSLAALFCMPAAALAFYMAHAWCVVWDEDIDKTFMSEIPGSSAPASDRALAHIRTFPALCLYVAPIALGALLPVVVLCVVALLSFLPSLSVLNQGRSFSYCLYCAAAH